MTWFLTTLKLLLLCRLSSKGLTRSIFGRCCRRRTGDLILFEGVMCLRPCQWRSLSQMDGSLVIKLLSDDFEFVPETDSFVFMFAVTSCVITNNYMHSFIQRMEYWNLFPFLKKRHESNWQILKQLLLICTTHLLWEKNIMQRIRNIVQTKKSNRRLGVGWGHSP